MHKVRERRENHLLSYKTTSDVYYIRGLEGRSSRAENIRPIHPLCFYVYIYDLYIP